MPDPSGRAADFSVTDGVGVLTLTSPPVNALSAGLVGDLRQSVAEAREAEPAILLIRSDLDASFCAGAELKETSGAETTAFVAYVEGIRDLYDEIADLGFPTLAAVDGAALGGGLELALACDLIFAGPGARLGLPEVKLGILPGAGGTQRLPQRIGASRAKEMMLSGRTVGPEEAERIGLAISSEAGAWEAANSWATDYLRNSSMAGNEILGCVEAAWDPDPAVGRKLELDGIGHLHQDGDARDRIRAFMESRRK